MARRSLKEMKSAFNSSTETGSDNRQNNYYPFYNMDFDEKAVVRFLPDANEENPLGFLVEKLTHVLTVNGERKTVPCLKMYGEDHCPVCEESRRLYKEEGEDSVNGKRLYRKKQHLAQVLVVEDPLPYKDDQTPAQGTIRFVNIGYAIYNRIKEAFEEDELEEVPDHYEEGTDFMIKKTLKGKYANYDGSKFLKRPRALTEEELAVVEGNLTDLSTLLPKKPTLEFVQTLLDADLNGRVLDEGELKNSSAAKPAKSSSSDDDDDDDVPVKNTKPAAASTDDDDDDDDFDADADSILADIKARRR